jgi:lysophospholipase L1-like esterase
MKVTLVASIFLILCHQNSAESGPYSWPKILLIGDSITEMGVGPIAAPWSAMLAGRFHREADIVNRGSGGYTTKGYKLIFREAVQELDPKSIAASVIFLGANDADPGSHVPLTDYQSNLKDLVKLLSDFGVSNDKVILLPPPPFYATFFKNRSPEVTQSYAEAALAVARESGITTLDIHTVFKKDPRGGKLFSDGLHFNFDGAKLFYDTILPLVEDKLKRYENRTTLLHHFGPPS